MKKRKKKRMADAPRSKTRQALWLEDLALFVAGVPGMLADVEHSPPPWRRSVHEAHIPAWAFPAVMAAVLGPNPVKLTATDVEDLVEDVVESVSEDTEQTTEQEAEPWTPTFCPRCWAAQEDGFVRVSEDGTVLVYADYDGSPPIWEFCLPCAAEDDSEPKTLATYPPRRTATPEDQRAWMESRDALYHTPVETLRARLDARRASVADASAASDVARLDTSEKVDSERSNALDALAFSETGKGRQCVVPAHEQMLMSTCRSCGEAWTLPYPQEPIWLFQTGTRFYYDPSTLPPDAQPLKRWPFHAECARQLAFIEPGLPQLPSPGPVLSSWPVLEPHESELGPPITEDWPDGCPQHGIAWDFDADKGYLCAMCDQPMEDPRTEVRDPPRWSLLTKDFYHLQAGCFWGSQVTCRMAVGRPHVLHWPDGPDGLCLCERCGWASVEMKRGSTLWLPPQL